MSVDSEMKIFGFSVAGEKSSWQIDMPTGAKIAMEIDLELDDMDAVQDFINHMEGKLIAHLTGRGWTPSSDGFAPDRRKDNGR